MRNKKMLLLLLVTLFTGFLLVACKPDSTLQNAYDDLALSTILAAGDTKDTVTKDLALPAEVGEVVITWVSSNVDAISNAGKVTRLEANASVKLTATITHGKKNMDKSFDLVVLAKETVDPGVVITSIADFLKDKEEVTIKGVITSLAPYNSFTIEDATGATALRVVGSTSVNIDFKVGDTLTVKVKHSVFNGLVQAEAIADHTVEDTKSTLPVATNISALDLTAEALLPLQSKLVDLDDVVVVGKTSGPDQATELMLENLDGQTIKLRWDNRMPGGEPAFLTSTKVGDVVSAKAALIGWFNTPQLAVENNTQLVAGTATEEHTTIANKAIVAADLKEFSFPISQSKAGVLELPEEGSLGSVITWEVTSGNAVRIDLSTGEFTMPYATEDLVLKVTVEKDGVSVDKEFTIMLKVEVDSLILVHHEKFELETMPSAYSTFTVPGTNDVTWEAVDSRNQDTYNITNMGIMVRGGAHSTISAFFSHGIESFSFEFRKAFTGGDLRSFKVDVISNEEVIKTFEVSHLFAEKRDDTIVEFKSGDLDLSGQPVTIVIYETSAQIVFDNFKWAQKDVELDAAATAALALTYDELLTAEQARFDLVSNLVLPTSIAGATITWTSSNDYVISSTGVVNRPAYNNEDIKLFAEIKVGEVTYVKNFSFTVPMAIADSGTYVADGKAGLGAFAKNPMDEDGIEISKLNQAEKVNLRSELFNVTGNMVSSYNNTVGISGEAIRLYADLATGRGSAISVSIKEGYKITGLVIVFLDDGKELSAGELVLDSEVEVLTALQVVSGTVTKESISIDSFSITNTHTHEKVAAQMWIESIAITYEKIEDGDYLNYHEDFEMEEMPAAYSNFIIPGINGINWQATDSRDNGGFDINGGGVMFRGGANSSLSAFFSHGMESFTFDFRKAFTGDKLRTFKVDIIVDEVVIQTLEGGYGFATKRDDTIAQFKSGHLGLSGQPVTVVIYDAAAQTVFSNFNWKQEDVELSEAALAALEVNYDVLLAEDQLRDDLVGNLTLPVLQDGVTITWASDNEDVISNTGLVTRAADKDTHVKLVATFTIGEFVVTKSFNFTVPMAIADAGSYVASPDAGLGGFAKNPRDLEGEVVLPLPNQAEKIGLRSELFNVTGTMVSDYDNTVGVTADSIRLYAHLKDSKGSTLTIEIKEGYEITEIEIVFLDDGKELSSGELVLGAVAETLTGDQILNKTVSRDGLSISSFSLQNTHEHEKVGAQMWIGSITITYAKVVTE